MKKKLFILKLLNFSVFTSIYLLQPVHGEHLKKLLSHDQLNNIHHQYDEKTSNRFTSWDHLLKNSKNKTTIEKLVLVNDFFNQMEWVEDKELWDSKDYWATPIESLLKNAGDCEDFSIAKYFTLLELGVPINQLKISYVKIVEDFQSHIVLAYYSSPDADPLILDNLNKEIIKRSERSDLILRFSFNGEGIWSHDNPHTMMDSVKKIRQWADLVKRMNQDQS